MTARPLIGITTYATNENGDVTLPVNYVDSVRRANGIPVLISPGESNTVQLLDRLDGLVLAGGGDIDPQCYGCPDVHESVYMLSADRDQTELNLARYTLERKLPTLAICRGIQIINVVLGGTLHQHLPDHVGEDVLHRAPPREPTPHAVEVSPESQIGAVMQATTVETMSWHHQAIHEPAEPLRVVATAPDGVIEAVEHPEHPELLAVQWHPELSSHRDKSQQRLFDQLVQFAAD